MLCVHFSLERCGEATKSSISGNPGRTMSSFSLSEYLGRLMLTACLRYLIWVTVHTSFMSLLYRKCSISQLQIQLLQGISSLIKCKPIMRGRGGCHIPPKIRTFRANVRLGHKEGLDLNSTWPKSFNSPLTSTNRCCLLWDVGSKKC